MELAMNGLTAALLVNAILAVVGACVIGLNASHRCIYNGKHDAARRR